MKNGTRVLGRRRGGFRCLARWLPILTVVGAVAARGELPSAVEEKLRDCQNLSLVARSGSGAVASRPEGSGGSMLILDDGSTRRFLAFKGSLSGMYALEEGQSVRPQGAGFESVIVDVWNLALDRFLPLVRMANRDGIHHMVLAHSVSLSPSAYLQIQGGGVGDPTVFTLEADRLILPAGQSGEGGQYAPFKGGGRVQFNLRVGSVKRGVDGKDLSREEAEAALLSLISGTNEATRQWNRNHAKIEVTGDRASRSVRPLSGDYGITQVAAEFTASPYDLEGNREHWAALEDLLGQGSDRAVIALLSPPQAELGLKVRDAILAGTNLQQRSCFRVPTQTFASFQEVVSQRIGRPELNASEDGYVLAELGAVAVKFRRLVSEMGVVAELLKDEEWRDGERQRIRDQENELDSKLAKDQRLVAQLTGEQQQLTGILETQERQLETVRSKAQQEFDNYRDKLKTRAQIEQATQILATIVSTQTGGVGAPILTSLVGQAAGNHQVRGLSQAVSDGELLSRAVQCGMVADEAGKTIEKVVDQNSHRWEAFRKLGEDDSFRELVESSPKAASKGAGTADLTLEYARSLQKKGDRSDQLFAVLNDWKSALESDPVKRELKRLKSGAGDGNQCVSSADPGTFDEFLEKHARWQRESEALARAKDRLAGVHEEQDKLAGRIVETNGLRAGLAAHKRSFDGEGINTGAALRLKMELSLELSETRDELLSVLHEMHSALLYRTVGVRDDGVRRELRRLSSRIYAHAIAEIGCDGIGSSSGQVGKLECTSEGSDRDELGVDQVLDAAAEAIAAINDAFDGRQRSGFAVVPFSVTLSSEELGSLDDAVRKLLASRPQTSSLLGEPHGERVLIGRSPAVSRAGRNLLSSSGLKLEVSLPETQCDDPGVDLSYALITSRFGSLNLNEQEEVLVERDSHKRDLIEIRLDNATRREGRCHFTIDSLANETRLTNETWHLEPGSRAVIERLDEKHQVALRPLRTIFAIEVAGNSATGEALDLRHERVEVIGNILYAESGAR